MKSMYKLIYPI